VQREAAGDSRIIFTGYVYGTRLEELYANAACFVLPSTVEGLPLSLLEAASYATPVVASAIAPHYEILGGDAPGSRLFSPGDEDGLVAALRRVLFSPARERSGAKGLQRKVIQTYRWDSAVGATLEVYRQAVERAGTAHKEPSRSSIGNQDMAMLG
jgi:glycosyltransferase involved in cell wall biosynthesis